MFVVFINQAELSEGTRTSLPSSIRNCNSLCSRRGLLLNQIKTMVLAIAGKGNGSGNDSNIDSGNGTGSTLCGDVTHVLQLNSLLLV